VRAFRYISIDTFYTLMLGTMLISCDTPSPNTHAYKPASLLILNAEIFDGTRLQTFRGGIAIYNDWIVAVGPDSVILDSFGDHRSRIIDAGGAFVMPGLIEGHAHLFSLGQSHTPVGRWIYGRGWHQEKWDKPPVPNVHGYPTHHRLSARTPHHPVVLIHASGHALLANRKAMELAGVDTLTPDPEGGKIVRDSSGAPTGIFEENAMHLILDTFAQYHRAQSQSTAYIASTIRRAIAHCIKNGITTFYDAATTPDEYRQWLKVPDIFTIPVFVMLYGTPSQIRRALRDKLHRQGTPNLKVKGVKAFLDGALGSYGAWLTEPYADRPNDTGQVTTPLDSIQKLAELCAQHQLQLCVHAIGDRANHEILQLFEQWKAQCLLPKHHHWRIEHAQHILPKDIPRFAQLGVIASVQPIHCTSDAPFVVKRLGPRRARQYSYPWRSLLDAKAQLAIGTDAPVEDINPFENIYAAVTRRRREDGSTFFPEQAMQRYEILHLYTHGNARALMEDHIGKIQPHYKANLVILSHNLLTCPTDSIPHTQVLYTIIDGRIRHSASEKF